MMRMMMMQQRRTCPGRFWSRTSSRPRPTPSGSRRWTIRSAPSSPDSVARLHLKVERGGQGVPARSSSSPPSQPDEAKELVKEFLRVWTRTHDPNASRNENRYSWFFFAFEQRAESIPLTRSKQERNLKELAGWVARIRSSPAVRAISTTRCSSRRSPPATARPRCTGPRPSRRCSARSADSSRRRSPAWPTRCAPTSPDSGRSPAEQEKKKTNRKKKDIEAEVLRGYAVARAVGRRRAQEVPRPLGTAGRRRPGSCTTRSTTARSWPSRRASRAKRADAFALYRKAAEEYAKAVRTMPEDEHTTNVYEQWFAASLGAVDLGMITEEKQPDWKQPALIRAAILALPGDLAEKHMGKFANNLFIKMSGRQAAREVQLPEGRLRDRRRPQAGRRGEEGVRLLQGPGHRDQAGCGDRRTEPRRATAGRSACSSTSATPATSSASPAASAATCRTRTAWSTPTTTAGRPPTTATASSPRRAQRSRSTSR